MIGLKISYFEPPVIFNFDKLSYKLPVGITALVSLEDATRNDIRFEACVELFAQFMVKVRLAQLYLQTLL
ncbi:hypothetical protein GXM_00179 [Nostoc sphaeroides CCNUC1]|uniref:Uncharacterized protein n=1 Tax=Nostoc sphaeroides CCNUC1 TaxID=2653204 RepID=A0A5P8VR43_9NOSO|nr:hypothetical protein GXM_00179 [Nostoc sphaeroides CCNUC1]